MTRSYQYVIAGVKMTLSEMAESAFTMLRDDEAAGDATACDHNIGIPHNGGYACSTCHKQFFEDDIHEFNEIWIPVEFGVVRIPIRRYPWEI